MSAPDAPSYSSEDEKVDAEKGLGVNDHIAPLADAEFDDPNLDKNAVVLEDDSPYPEVRSAVANTDDPSMPASTIRSWVIGLIFAIIMSGLNQFFFFRYPSVTIGNLVAQLLTFPCGRLWARFMPNVSIFGKPLNPGPYTVKEHVLSTIMATRVYYNQTYSFGYQWLVVMSTQLIGFSIGGIARRFLVQPPSMIWPANLVNCALFNTLHQQNYAGVGNRGGMPRERFFAYALLAATSWYFFPGYIFQALSYFSWVCWIAPDNIKINQLFGYSSGLGILRLLALRSRQPWWAEANVFTGFVFFFWFITPILYYSNVWYAQYMPISSRTSFDNTGASYDVTRILNDDSTINLDKYRCAITATLTHAFLYFRKQIWTQARKSMHEQPDIHARLMSVYPQVPDWWYVIVFLSMFVFGIISIEVWPTQFPVWAFVLGLLISFFYMIPIGMIQAITNQQVGLNVITELVIGYMLPGHPVAMMLFKTWGYITMYQGLVFTSDFKLGHYMKVPPRPMFWGQIVATVVAGTVQLGVQAWMFTNISDMCSPKQPDGFICPSTEVFGTASIIWGVIGPALQFSKGQIYYGLLFFFLIGMLAPIFSYVMTYKFPNSFFKYVNFPVIFTGTGLIPPATAMNYVPWAIVGFVFQYVIRRRHFSWWTKYNYVLSAALDSSVAIAVILIFFCLQYPKNGSIGATTIQTWWGNTVYQKTGDWDSVALRTVADGATFGPTSW
ncbi:oligopeptide transporter [Phellopilus nigrolimitatus]|nr:oligopeptide transporter [Phellopilus nigrolimitatus]